MFKQVLTVLKCCGCTPMAVTNGSSHAMTEPVRPRRRSLLWVTAVLLAAVLLWDACGLDLAVMHVWGSAQGFALKNHFLLSGWLHNRGQQASVAIYLLMWFLVLFPMGPWRALTRRERTASALAVTASVLTISLLKHFSLTSCPWDLRLFGGSADYVSHWAWGVADRGSGKCFPGGHASSAFGFLAASLPFLLSGQAQLRRYGWRMLGAIVLLGLVFGLTQTVRGAHYPSHTLWTAWICWAVGLIVYQLVSARRAACPVPDRAD